tara:strand:- start:512 stop:772 length:261 start_codon:yes stop_codon:yes gene_type:complete
MSQFFTQILEQFGQGGFFDQQGTMNAPSGGATITPIGGIDFYRRANVDFVREETVRRRNERMMMGSGILGSTLPVQAFTNTSILGE